MTVREALAKASADLKAAGIDTPSLDASLLLAKVLNISRTALAAAGTEPLSEEALAAFGGLIDRRLNGECAAYILGKKEFRGLEFLVNPSVLVPRPDTETLIEAAIAISNEQLAMSNEQTAGYSGRAADNIIRVLDLCTGSGAVAISLKNEMPRLEVWATDISAEALETAKTNASHLLPADSIQFLQGDLYNALPSSNCSLLIANCSFSLIISNPPYIPSGEIQALSAEVRNEPRLALDGGPSGLSIIERIIDGAPEYLKKDGVLLMEADPRQMKKIAILLEKQGFNSIKLYKDLSGQERVIGGTYV